MFLVLSGIAIELSWIFYFKALQQGQASLAAPVDASSLVITIVLAAIFLEAAIIWRIACGALLITAGRLIIVLQRSVWPRYSCFWGTFPVRLRLTRGRVSPRRVDRSPVESYNFQTVSSKGSLCFAVVLFSIWA
jgi:hypothetical protein